MYVNVVNHAIHPAFYLQMLVGKKRPDIRVVEFFFLCAFVRDSSLITIDCSGGSVNGFTNPTNHTHKPTCYDWKLFIGLIFFSHILEKFHMQKKKAYYYGKSSYFDGMELSVKWRFDLFILSFLVWWCKIKCFYICMHLGDWDGLKPIVMFAY